MCDTKIKTYQTLLLNKYKYNKYEGDGEEGAKDEAEEVGEEGGRRGKAEEVGEEEGRRGSQRKWMLETATR